MEMVTLELRKIKLDKQFEVPIISGGDSGTEITSDWEMQEQQQPTLMNCKSNDLITTLMNWKSNDLILTLD